MAATVIDFEPTGNKSAFLVQAGGMYWQGSIRDMSFSSSDTTSTKTAIEIVDASDFVVENVSIAGNVVVGNTRYWSGAGSIGIRTRGREDGLFHNVSIAADRPLLISQNPNHPISIDHHRFHDCYFIANGNPVVEIQSGVNLTNVTFDGVQAWVKGTYGLRWLDTVTAWASLNLRLENVRWEQAEDPGGYFLDIEHNHALYNLLLQNCYESVEANGVRLRNVRSTTFQHVIYPNITGGTALDVDATVFPIVLDNSFFQTGTILQTAGLTKVFDIGRSSLSGTLNPFVIYDKPSGASGPMLNLPSSNPGAGSKQLWYDPADSDRVKFAK